MQPTQISAQGFLLMHAEMAHPKLREVLGIEGKQVDKVAELSEETLLMM